MIEILIYLCAAAFTWGLNQEFRRNKPQPQYWKMPRTEIEYKRKGKH